MEAERTHPDALLDDAAAIRRVLAGDKQQFAVLVSRYQSSLYRHAVSMVLDHDVAADMVQDTFVRAYSRLATCREHNRFRAWIFQMLQSLPRLFEGCPSSQRAAGSRHGHGSLW